uniref:non-specific serine/threonine protein kinase n=1 Tax=Hippocampus comes TaxID=109280 RepID=A0A3Q2Z411_HIPCM
LIISALLQISAKVYLCVFAGSLDHKYQQLEKIGEGGFGSVYAGYRKADSFPVAIKHIPKHENIKGRKHDVPVEALLMLQASCIKDADGHSAVVSLLDKYDLDQELVLVMEKPARSVDLFTYITRCRLGHLKENEAKVWMERTVYLNVFHRDLKPGNILLEATYGVPRVRVIDFGFSASGSVLYLTAHHCFVLGTLSYAPPEFVLRGTYRAGPTTVWHLGAMLFELLAGSKQFDTLLFISQMLQLNRVLSQGIITTVQWVHCTVYYYGLKTRPSDVKRKKKKKQELICIFIFVSNQTAETSCICACIVTRSSAPP